MEDADREILARFTAIEQILAFLLGQHLRALPPAHSEAVRASMLGNEHNLRAGVGLMDAETLQDVRLQIEASLERMICHAHEMEQHWRQAE